MSTEDKKIVPFSGGDGNKEKNDRQKRTDSGIRRAAQWISKHLGLSVLAGVVVPVLIAVVGPSLSKNFGGTRLTDSYTMPYSYAADNYVANVRESDTEARIILRERRIWMRIFMKRRVLCDLFSPAAWSQRRR